MAYYDDGYMWAQEHTTYFPEAYQDPVSSSSYEHYGHVDANYDAYSFSVFQEPKSVDYGYDYDDYGHGNYHNRYSCANPAINYLAHNYMEPKLIAYEPVECETGYVSYHTQHSISYSKVNSGFNEPEFEEYDPTPYGGGYDIISEYGKPLPPSDQTCYPRSKPKPIGPRPTPNFESQLQTKSSPEPEPKPKPKPEPVPMATPIPLVEPKPKPETEPQPEPVLVPGPGPLELREVGEREKEEYSYPIYGYDYPWPEYERANGTGVGYDYGYGKQVVQIPPCEFSPEVVDLCESIFGSWPCLARIRKQQAGIENNPRVEIGQHNPWEECADYFLGRPMASYNV